jgi:hypothetical protein
MVMILNLYSSSFAPNNESHFPKHICDLFHENHKHESYFQSKVIGYRIFVRHNRNRLVKSRIKTATCFAELKISSATFIPSKLQDCAKVPNQKLSDFIFTSLVMITVFESASAMHHTMPNSFNFIRTFITPNFHPSKTCAIF